MVSRMAAPQAATSRVLSCTVGVAGWAWLGLPLCWQLPVTGSGWRGSRVWGAPHSGHLTIPSITAICFLQPRLPGHLPDPHKREKPF